MTTLEYLDFIYGINDFLFLHDAYTTYYFTSVWIHGNGKGKGSVFIWEFWNFHTVGNVSYGLRIAWRPPRCLHLAECIRFLTFYMSNLNKLSSIYVPFLKEYLQWLKYLKENSCINAWALTFGSSLKATVRTINYMDAANNLLGFPRMFLSLAKDTCGFIWFVFYMFIFLLFLLSFFTSPTRVTQRWKNVFSSFAYFSISATY